MSSELHLSKKDFKLEWYSGTGGGGQHRNKHQNCCRITHIGTGLVACGTASKSRVANQKHAFSHLAAKLIAHYADPETARGTDGDRVRSYNMDRNEVIDHASGLQMTYKDVVEKGKIGPLVEARRNAKIQQT